MTPFRFKQFSVRHSRSTMKVGTDAVLLGAWCRVDDAGAILDVGTGCGVVALMMAQRNAHAVIDAIDIDAASVAEASGNFADSPWPSRLRASQADFNDWVGEYDLIVSNPPFFADGLRPPDNTRAQARHALTLTYTQLLEGARSMLAPDGRVCFITPAEARSMIIELVTFQAMNVARLCEVTPVEGKGVKRLLWEVARRHGPMQREALAIAGADGRRTGAYRALCDEFYL